MFTNRHKTLSPTEEADDEACQENADRGQGGVNADAR
jgi:hypothetical protein